MEEWFSRIFYAKKTVKNDGRSLFCSKSLQAMEKRTKNKKCQILEKWKNPIKLLNKIAVEVLQKYARKRFLEQNSAQKVLSI